LLENHREANHEIVIGYRKEFFIKDILKQFSLIKERLEQEGIIAYHIVEITRDDFGKPVNRIHYHFLVDSHYSKNRLKRIFKGACRYARLEIGKDCRVLHFPIPDRKTFKRKCKYILKYDTYSEQAILFRPKTGIDKIGAIGHWFINADGTRASKTKMWKSIVAGWYPENKQLPIRVTIRLSVALQI
jgi:hypothetical protein